MFDPSILFDAIGAHGMLAQATRPALPAPGNTFRCGFLQPDSLILGDAVQTGDITIEYVASEAVGLRLGEALVINGQGYRVRQPPARKGDGYYMTAMLETVEIVP